MGSLPGTVSVDRPLKLGSTFLGQGGDEGYYSLKLDFQPESLRQAQQADLLLLGADQLKLIPLLPDGDCPFHFEGSLEQQQQRSGNDVECVAYFDGNEWTLQLVQAHLRAKHRPGVPLVPGYNVDVPEDDEPAAGQHTADVSAVQQQLQASSIQPPHAPAAAVHAEHEIDPDLDDALEEALFATDRTSSQPQQSDPEQPTHSAAAVTQPVRGHEVHSQPQKPLQQPVQHQQHPPQQLAQQHPRPVQQQQQPQVQQRQQQPAQPVVQQRQAPPPQQHRPTPPAAAAAAAAAAPPPAALPAAAAAAEDEEESADDDSDDPWNTFDAAAAPAPVPVPAAPKPAAPHVPMHRHMATVSGGNGGSAHRSTTPQPAAAAAAHHQAAPAHVRPASAPAAQPVAAAAAVPAVVAGGSGVSRGAVSVLGGDEDDDEEAGHDAQECSEDESDGVGVEYF